MVKLLGLGEDGKQVVLEIEGGDFLNGTPVYDIKPYVPYADRIEDATSAWAQTEESRMAVNYDEETVAKGLSAEERQRLDEQIGFIRESLSLTHAPLMNAARMRERGKPGASCWVILK